MTSEQESADLLRTRWGANIVEPLGPSPKTQPGVRMVIGSPYYYPLDRAMQRRHVETILQGVPLTILQLPILLYNIH